MPLVDIFETIAATYPRKTALVQGRTRVTYGELRSRIKTLAVQLAEGGVREGCRVALRLPNSIDYIALTYAIWDCGATVIPVGRELTQTECDALIRRMAPDFLISDQPVPGGSAQHDAVEAPYYLALTGYARAASQSVPGAAFIRFTSGTTGDYKGVVLTHATIVERITALNTLLDVGPADTVIWTLSMAHHFVSTIVLYLSRGAGIVLTGGATAANLLRAAATEQASILYAAPFHYLQLAGNASEQTLPTLRLAISTTMALSEGVADAFYRRYGLPVAQAYGIIEIGLVCVNTGLPMEKKGSVGLPVPGYEVCIRNAVHLPDQPYPCGEIFVRGPGFFDAYISPFRPSETVLDDGWFDTGDIGTMDPEGYVYLLGRKKDMINVAGLKVFPLEVETVLSTHPDVAECRVFGTTDARFGERVAAEVVAVDRETSVSSLRKYCRRRLAAHKVPDMIRFINRVERTPVTGKILRRPARSSESAATDGRNG